MSDVRKPHRDRVGVELADAEMRMVAGRLHAMADEAEAGRNAVHIDVPGFRALADYVDKWARCVGQTCEAVECGRPDEFHVCKSCSKCSYGWFEDIYDKPYSYCPNCGARVVSGND